MHDGKYDDVLAVDEVENPLGKLAQQRSSGTGLGIDYNLCGGLCLDARKGNTHRQQKSFRGTNAPFAIPRHSLGNVGAGLRGEDNLCRHNPCCLRILASATAQETPA